MTYKCRSYIVFWDSAVPWGDLTDFEHMIGEEMSISGVITFYEGEVQLSCGYKDDIQGYYNRTDINNKRDLTILATGSEVSIALKTKEILEKNGLNIVVVSMPCWEIFDTKSKTFQESILGPLNIRIGIEAASKFGWSKYLKNDKYILGMENFGASAPSEDLFNHFGFDAKKLADLGSKIILKKK